ncbi:kinetochore Sim4 complex subunit Fta4 [Neurospora crassa]|nr:kinetochore Sim4 complex subunit Fta4 [Neurospora crassa]
MPPQQQPPPPTILSLKSDFLNTQTRTLSQPLAPTRTFTSQNNGTSSPHLQSQEQHQSIPQKPLSEALQKLNHRLTQHNRRAYPPQATRHVAEQIDKLYFTSTSTSTSLGKEDEDDEEDEDGEQAWLRVNADLTVPRLITSIPDSWSSVSEKEADDHPMEAKRFAELVAQLKELDQQKRKVLERVARLRKIKGLVEGFAASPAQDLNTEGEQVREGAEGEGGGGGMKAVQENLVTKNGEMEAELQRMRVLLARVGGRVEKLDKERGKEKERGSGSDERKKLDKLLDSF